MASELGDAAIEAANLALKMGSAAVDVVSFMAELGEQVPVIGPVLKTLTAIREKVENVQSNREELEAIEQRCTYMTACVIVKFRQISSPNAGPEVTSLEDCVEAARSFAERCSGRGKLGRVLKASRDKEELASLNARIDRLAGGVGLAGIATVSMEVTDLKRVLEQAVRNQEVMIGRLDDLRKPQVTMADVPQRTPIRKSWYVERHHVMVAVLEALIGKRGSCLVGLVGDSGAGKTTAASEIVRSVEVREAFSDGIVWLTVNNGATKRLPSLMLQLARMVYEDIGGRVGVKPKEADEGCSYVRRRMENHSGKRLKCLVVADDVWEKEVVSQLLKTGMSILVTTREGELVTKAHGVPVQVDELSEADAESVLRNAAEIHAAVRLPDDAADLIELCGRIAMDLSFVGRWSIVRGRQDRTAWSDAAAKVRAETTKVGDDSRSVTAQDFRARRRKAILRAGFEDLAAGSEDERVQRLYLALAVMPNGHGFEAKDAAILLYNRSPTAEDETAVRVVVKILERWSVLRPTRGGTYFMHDAHSDFSRENLMDRDDVRRPAVERWVRHLSSLDTLRSNNHNVIKDLWLRVEQIGGDSWDNPRPYEAAIAQMDESDPLFRKSAEQMGRFLEAQQDWERASSTWRRVLKVVKGSIAWRQLLDSSVLDDEDLPEVVFLFPNVLNHLIVCARKKKATEEEAELRNQWYESIPYWATVTDGPSDDLASEFRLQCEVYAKTHPNDNDVEAFLKQCLVINMVRRGPEHVLVANTLRALGAHLQRANHLEEAEKLLKRSIRIGGANRDLDDVWLAKARRELGVCMRKTGRLDDANEIMRCALDTLVTNVDPKNLEVGLTLHELGVSMRECKLLSEAEEMLKRSLEIMQEDGDVESTYWMADTLYELSMCARDAGRSAEEVEDLLTRSRKARQAHEEATQEHLADLARDDTFVDDALDNLECDDCCVIS